MERLDDGRVTASEFAKAGFDGRTAIVGDVRLHYWIGGNRVGRPVVLLHGFLSTSHAWRKVAPALADAGYAVLVPDMRGYGDSDKPEGVSGYDARSLAKDCRGLVAKTAFGAGTPMLIAAHDMGALPALMWAADHPDEVAGLLYIEAPVMLGDDLRRFISYTPQAMARGSMWWWILPLAPGVPERLVVGREREFLTWFYEGASGALGEIGSDAIDEVLRTFSGREGVLGAMGVYRAAFTSIEQTEPLTSARIATPVTAMGGERGLGLKVAAMLSRVAANVEEIVLPGCGHFIPEERPDAVVAQVLALAGRTGRRSPSNSNGDVQ